jgi:hypothetical protein
MAKQSNPKQKPIFGLEKLPKKGMIKALQLEVETLKSERAKYLDKLIELGNRIAELEELQPEARGELLNHEEVVRLKKEVKALKHKNMQLTKDNKNHINTILTLKQKSNGNNSN